MPYTPHTKEDISLMLKEIGLKKEDELFDVVPKELRAKSFDLPEGMSEFEAYEKLKNIASKNNTDKVLFMGGGYYDHVIPACVDALSSRSEFYTAYTPYQAEASQGTLQALYEYQTLICRLFEMDETNASMYDGGSALAEAALMSIRARRRDKVLLDYRVNPIYKDIVKTYLKTRGFDVVEVGKEGVEFDKESIFKEIDEKTASYIFQNPNFFGSVEDYEEIIQALHSKKALAIGLFYPLSLGVLKTPGEMDVDIACADGQSLGNYLGFGGPSFGIMAAKKEFIRQLPGRIVGKTVDRNGKEAFVLTLQAREQHIRREKATSNICSNQNLMALRATIFLTSIGKEGLKELAELNLQKAAYLKELLLKINGVEVVNRAFTFNEFVIKLPKNSSKIFEKFKLEGFYAGIELGKIDKNYENHLLIAVTEKRTKEQMDRFAKLLGEMI
jgi:glycine dehydrogenase subunit 1